MIGMIGDIHFGIKGGNKVYHDYLCDRLRNTLSEMHSKGITEVFQLGDFFDSRRQLPIYILPFVMIELPNLLRQYGITLHILTGNHDVYYLKDNTVNSLLVFEHIQEIKVYTSPTYVNVDNMDIIICPWVHELNYNETLSVINKYVTSESIILGHFELTGFKMYATSSSSQGHFDMSCLARAKAVYTGHYHHPSNNGNVYYIGSSSVLTRSDVCDESNKGWYSLDRLNFNFHPIPGTLFKTIHYYDGFELTDDLNNINVDFIIPSSIVDSLNVDAIIKTLKNSNILSLKIVDNRLKDVVQTDAKSYLSIKAYLDTRMVEEGLSQNTIEYLTTLHDSCQSIIDQ